MINNIYNRIERLIFIISLFIFICIAVPKLLFLLRAVLFLLKFQAFIASSISVFLDEYPFYLNGIVTRHNCRYWYDETPSLVTGQFYLKLLLSIRESYLFNPRASIGEQRRS